MGLGIRAQHLMAHAATAGALLTCLAIVVGIGRLDKSDRQDPLRMAPEAGAPAWTMSLAAVAPAETAPPAIAANPAIEVPEPQPVMADLPPPITISDVTPSAAVAPDERSPEPEPDVVGLWAPDASSCSLRSFRQGLLPTIINMQGAWAGETACLFKNRKQTDTGWRVLAQCSSGGDHWTTQVQLTLKGNRLTWESRRGRQVYTRCGTDLRMAKAP